MGKNNCQKKEKNKRPFSEGEFNFPDPPSDYGQKIQFMQRKKCEPIIFIQSWEKTIVKKRKKIKGHFLKVNSIFQIHLQIMAKKFNSCKEKNVNLLFSSNHGKKQLSKKGKK